jgi:putative membrane protein
MSRKTHEELVNTPAAADSSTALALERTRLAHERTLMAWVRTATSLISFGFTIYKAFEYLRQRQPDVAHGVLGPRNFALVLIGLGIGSLVLATVQHRGDVRRLEAQYGSLPRSTAAIVATIVSLLGIVALILVFLRQ